MARASSLASSQPHGPARPAQPRLWPVRPLWPRQARRRARGHPRRARRRAHARLPDHAAAPGAQRRLLASQPRFGLPDPAAARRPGPRQERGGRGQARLLADRRGRAEAEETKERGGAAPWGPSFGADDPRFKLRQSFGSSSPPSSRSAAPARPSRSTGRSRSSPRRARASTRSSPKTTDERPARQPRRNAIRGAGTAALPGLLAVRGCVPARRHRQGRPPAAQARAHR